MMCLYIVAGSCACEWKCPWRLELSDTPRAELPAVVCCKTQVFGRAIEVFAHREELKETGMLIAQGCLLNDGDTRGDINHIPSFHPES